jgi:hypothetical protein
VKELPDLDRFHATQAAGTGWQVVALAIDGPTAVREFLARRPLRFPGRAGRARRLGAVAQPGNATGRLPFTVVLDAAGRVVRRKLGATTYDELVAWTKTG